MAKIPIIRARVMIEFLHGLGFEQIRQKGSHKFFRHDDGRTATVPDHKGEDLGRGIQNKILKDVKVSKKDFMNWYKKK